MSSPAGLCLTPVPVIPGYEILRVLDQGGMGIVYLASQVALNRLACVKVLSDLGEEPVDVRRARFAREAELLASIVHPHVLCIFDFGVTADAGLPFLATEFFERGSLRGILEASGPLPQGDALGLLAQIGQALEFMHAKGIIHRDLKPENVFMATPTLCKVGDFGLAVRPEKAGLLTRSVRGLGTAGYISPEQQYGLKVGERSDQFSLAALACELLSGRRPLGYFAPPSEVNPALPAALDRVIQRGMADEPEDRYPSIREFLNDLEKVLQTSGREQPFRRLVVPALPVAAAGLIGATLWIAPWRHNERSPMARARLLDGPLPTTRAEPHPPNQVSATPPDLKPREWSFAFTELLRHRVSRLEAEAGIASRNHSDVQRAEIWKQAERQVDTEVDQRAYHYWEEQGSPQGAAGEVVRPMNRIRAEVDLLRETEEELRQPPGHANPSP